ncbi:VIT domain-containing protein [Ekhidna sp.]
MKTLFTFIAMFIFSTCFSQIPSLTIGNDDKKRELEISSLDVNVEIIGNIATTTYDIIFFNPQSRDLEGELSLPLGEGQEICRYALSVNGKLREGVVIEKVKARQAFEAVTRQNIDPGIINITKGNFFKTRIYPISSKGNKRVVLAISETLSGDKNNLYYSLPIETSKSIGEFNLNVKAIKSRKTDKAILSEFENIQFDDANDAFVLSLSRKNFSSSNPIKFTLPRFGGSDHQLFTHEFEGETYFYLNIKPPTLSATNQKKSEKVGIFWDNSSSGAKRDIEKELKLLESYLNSLTDVKEISVTSFNAVMNESENFGGSIPSVISCIRELTYDGATRFDQINLHGKYDEILLFSDGINTIGTEDIRMPKNVVHTITSSSGSNYSLLKKLARKTNGEFINLHKTSTKDALNILQKDEEKFLSSSYSNADFKEVYPNLPQRVGEYFEIAGILKTEKARIKINYGDRNNVTKSQSFEIEKKSTAPISRLWASKKIETLNIDYQRNKEAIFTLAQKHNIVTKNSSFIVLDRVEDYAEYEIEPPIELKKEYDRLIAQKEISKPDPKAIFQRNFERFSSLKNWYASPPIISQEDKDQVDDSSAVSRSLQGTVAGVEVESADEEAYIILEEAPEEEALQEVVVTGYSATSRAKSSVESTSGGSSIKVLAWLPDAPYMEELRGAAENHEKLYFKLKEENSTRPAFFIQVSDFFFDKGMNKIAVRILSNAIELDLENPELIRAVAKRLLDEDEIEMSVSLFLEIKELRPEEPQSYRDLALAYIENKQYQQALELFNYVLNKDWARFADIKDVVLNELNNLISLYKDELDLSSVSKELIEPMPLDVRIVIDWSSNDSDIDLWVIDPNGEKCFYSHPNTKIGGKISRDFTEGYGPEEYSLKEAKRGFYTVYVNYYSESRQTITGPVTIYGTLTTNYGTSKQETKRIAVQLTDNKESRQIAQLEFRE